MTALPRTADSTADRHTDPGTTAGLAAIASATRGIGPVGSSAVFVARSLRHSLRDGEGLLMAVALPVLLLLMFTYVFGGAIAGDGYLDFVVPGVILTTAGYGASSVAVSVNRDVTQGAMRRLRTLPITASTVLAGHVVASVLRNLLATAIVLVVALAIGFSPAASPAQWISVLALITLWILAITALFAGIGMVTGSPEAANGYGFILLFLPYLSSAFVPVETMPEWIQPVADHQPMAPLVESLRHLMIGAGDERILASVLWSLGILLVAAAGIGLGFHRSKDR